MSNHFIIQLAEFKEFEKPFTQDPEKLNIGRIVGYLDAKNFVKMFNYLSEFLPSASLDANPRKPKETQITKDIMETLKEDAPIFHLMSKGLLLSVSDCVLLSDRNRVKLSMNAHSKRDGILDGGHNTLAICKHFLERIIVDNSSVKKIKNIEVLIEEWLKNKDTINTYMESNASLFTFLVPIDIVFPKNVEFEEHEKQWFESHYKITTARNNNAQLSASTVDQYKGYHADIKEILKNTFGNRIIWTSGESGCIPVDDIVALSLIPLSKIAPEKVGSGSKIYSGRGSCQKVFKDILVGYGQLDEKQGIKKVTNSRLKSLLVLLPEFLRAYDYLYKEFPRVYNSLGGKFGRITGVESFDLPGSKLKKAPLTKFTEQPCTYKHFDAYILPILVALKELIVENEAQDGFYLVQSIEDYLKEKLPSHTITVKTFMDAFQFYPDKIGKASGIYETLTDAVKKDVEIFLSK
jgi:hypothetical protein